MHTDSLLTFLHLAELKNFTRTAEKLFIAQSTVTSRIADLEKEVGKPLFSRNNKHVELTAEGRLFVDYCRRMINLQEAALRAVNTADYFKRNIHIGTTNTIYECHLAPILPQILKNYKDISIKVTIGHSPELTQMLRDQVIDILYSYHPMEKKGCRSVPIASDDLLLVTGVSDSPYQNGISQKELIHLDYLFCNFALHEVGTFIRELFPEHYQFPFEIDNGTKLKDYLLSGIGYSFLPRGLVNKELQEKKLFSIPLKDFSTPKMTYYSTFLHVFPEIPGFFSALVPFDAD